MRGCSAAAGRTLPPARRAAAAAAAAVGVAALQLEARARLAPEVLDRARHVVVQRDAAALRQIIEQGGRRFEEQRQVILDAGGGTPLETSRYRDFFDGSPSNSSRQRLRKRGAARLVERKLARRQQPDLLHRVERALRVDIEGLDRLDDLVIQVEAVGQRAARRKQIDQPPRKQNSPGATTWVTCW